MIFPNNNKKVSLKTFYLSVMSDFADCRCLKPLKAIMILFTAGWTSVFLRCIVVIFPQQYRVFGSSVTCSASLNFVLVDNSKPQVFTFSTCKIFYHS